MFVQNDDIRTKVAWNIIRFTDRGNGRSTYDFQGVINYLTDKNCLWRDLEASCSFAVYTIAQIKLLLYLVGLPLWNNINRYRVKRGLSAREANGNSLSVGRIEPSRGRWYGKKSTISLPDVFIASDQSLSLPGDASSTPSKRSIRVRWLLSCHYYRRPYRRDNPFSPFSAR